MPCYRVAIIRCLNTSWPPTLESLHKKIKWLKLKAAVLLRLFGRLQIHHTTEDRADHLINTFIHTRSCHSHHNCFYPHRLGRLHCTGFILMAQVLQNHNPSLSSSFHSWVDFAQHPHSQAKSAFHTSSHWRYGSIRVCHKTTRIKACRMKGRWWPVSNELHWRASEVTTALRPCYLPADFTCR